MHTAVVRTLGALTPLDIPVSGFRLHPIVGAAPSRPAFTASRHEVARVLEIDLERLTDPAVLTTRDADFAGRRLTFPAYTLDGVEVWGATAMVLAEFLSLISPS